MRRHQRHRQQQRVEAMKAVHGSLDAPLIQPPKPPSPNLACHFFRPNVLPLDAPVGAAPPALSTSKHASASRNQLAQRRTLAREHGRNQRDQKNRRQVLAIGTAKPRTSAGSSTIRWMLPIRHFGPGRRKWSHQTMTAGTMYNLASSASGVSNTRGRRPVRGQVKSRRKPAEQPESRPRKRTQE